MAVCQPALALDLDALWDFANPALSEQRFRAALADAGPDDALILQTQIARSYGLRRDFQRALEILQELKPLTASAGVEARTRYFLELGRSYASATHPPESQTAQSRELARAAFADAAEAAKNARLDGLRVDALHMMAFVDTAPADQLTWAREALAVAETSAQDSAKRWEPSLRNNIGYALHQQGQYAEALAEFRAALQNRERDGNAESVRVARWMVAWTLRALKRYGEATTLQLQLERERNEAKRPSPYVYEELAELYQAQGDEARAAHYRTLKHSLQGGK